MVQTTARDPKPWQAADPEPKTFAAADGEVRVYRMGAASVAELIGRCDASHATDLVAQLQAALEDGATHVFLDASHLKSYQTAFRHALTGWFTERSDALDAIHVHAVSHLVVMGFSIAQNQVANMTQHRDLGGFLVALKRAVA